MRYEDYRENTEELAKQSTRNESVNKLYEVYKREHEKLKEYAAFDRTLREVESLPEIKTDFGD
jgi:hypothetical protein